MRWQQWVNLVLGLWIALSAYLDFNPVSIATNLTIVGLAIALMAVWDGLESREEHIEHVERKHMHA